MPYSAAADEFERLTGHRPSRCSWARWCRVGVKLAGGRVVRLRAVRCGGQWAASAGAVAEFLAALNGGA